MRPVCSLLHLRPVVTCYLKLYDLLTTPASMSMSETIIVKVENVEIKILFRGKDLKYNSWLMVIESKWAFE